MTGIAKKTVSRSRSASVPATRSASRARASHKDAATFTRRRVACRASYSTAACKFFIMRFVRDLEGGRRLWPGPPPQFADTACCIRRELPAQTRSEGSRVFAAVLGRITDKVFFVRVDVNFEDEWGTRHRMNRGLIMKRGRARGCLCLSKGNSIRATGAHDRDCKENGFAVSFSIAAARRARGWNRVNVAASL
jgi:hypothetical protein